MRSFIKSIVFFEWTTALLRWLILVAGTTSECIFLIASVYLCLNANVHELVLAFMSEGATRILVDLSTASFVALPECIVFLAVTRTLAHWRMYRQTKDRIPLMWAVLFALPTFNFALLTVVTLAQSVLSVGFELPPFLVVARALSAYGFAFLSLLYNQIGKEQEADRLNQKDSKIEQLYADITRLENEKASLQATIEDLSAELNDAKVDFAARLNAQNRKIEAKKETCEMALQDLPQDLLELSKSQNTCSFEAAISAIGISKRKFQNAIARGEIRKTTRGQHIFVSSLVDYWSANQIQKERQLVVVPADVSIQNVDANFDIAKKDAQCV